MRALLPIAALIAAQAAPTAPAPAPPQGLMRSLTTMQAEVERAGGCVEAHPQWRLREALRRRDQRLLAAVGDAVSLWGRPADPASAPRSARGSACTRAAVEASFAAFDSAVARFESAYAATTAPMVRGLWFGGLRICGAGAVADESIDAGVPAVAIALPTRLRGPFTALTDAAVYQYLAVRLDGRIVARPHVNEPIRGGTVSLIGPDAATAARLRQAAAEPC
jgi:hypothetical protein